MADKMSMRESVMKYLLASAHHSYGAGDIAVEGNIGDTLALNPL
jgi:hypothetical protein